MMMKMLAEGGLSVVTDELRSADDDNPNGYFELEAVKRMSAGNVAWFADAEGKVVKVISALLEYLPSKFSYKIIFMEREIKEILASQLKMLTHRNETSRADEAEIEAQFRKHLEIVKPWLVRQPNMKILFVSYNKMLSEAAPLCEKILEFLGAPLDVSRMKAVPRRDLYRNRKDRV